MHTLLLKRLLVSLISISLISNGIPPIAEAGMIGTQDIIAAQERDQMLTRIEAYLARENVRRQMMALGVDPADIQQRISALTDKELHKLYEGMDSIPAGGYSMPAGGFVNTGGLFLGFAIIVIIAMIITVTITKDAHSCRDYTRECE